MKHNKYIFTLLALCFVSLLGLSSCNNDEYEEPTMSNDEITFTASEWNSVSSKSRAALYDTTNIYDATKGGGNFTVSAYTTADGTPYFENARVWFFNDPQVNRWIFLDKYDSPISYYWPNKTNLNFFAYMPNIEYTGKDGYLSKETHTTLGSYTHGAGQTFSCNLPENVDIDTEMQEFIYAYITNQKKRNDAVVLRFHHPYATINFKIGVDSYRMTIGSIQLSGIYLNGTYSTGAMADNGKEIGEWTPSQSAGTKTYTLGLNKRIPNEINYNTLLFDGFLVMPQTLQGSTLTLNYNRYNDTDGNNDANEHVSIDFSKITAKWEQGKQYTYTIKIGDNKDEIYFNVMVEEDWIKNGETNIDVE